MVELDRQVVGAGDVRRRGAPVGVDRAEDNVAAAGAEADDVDELAERLRVEGHDDATVWDEAYGRVLRVDVPGAVSVWVDERSDDLYGYRLHKAEPDDRWSVRPLLTTEDPDGWQKLLRHLDTGLVEIAPGPAYDVQLGLRTTEDLGVVAARLADSGFVVESGEGQLIVRDPDGCPVRVTR